MSIYHAKKTDIKVVNSATAVTEYGMIGQMDAAQAEISGRYPETGYSLNTISDMIVTVTRGNGTITTPDTSIQLTVGDTIYIDKMTKYAWSSDGFTIVMVSSPAWTPEQYKHIV